MAPIRWTSPRSCARSSLAGGDWFGFHLQGSDEYQWTYTNIGADTALVRLNIDYSTAAVPEPITLLLLGSGLVLGYRRMRRA